MTGLRSMMGRLFGGMAIQIEGAPEAELSIAPDSVEQVARLLDFASEHGLVVLPWGGGAHQGLGGRIAPDVIVSTARLDRVVEWDPDDLMVVAGAGLTVGALQETVAPRHQTAVLPEQDLDATVGGVVAAGVSGWRRLRYGPTRDRVLQVEFVTGDGRVVTGGARVVKNVTGYDLPRLLTGSFGSLGIITTTCLKLWPEPERTVTVTVDDVERALAVAYRPNAVLETPSGVAAYLGGPAAEVEAQAAALGGDVREGFHWPKKPDGECTVRVRVPAADVTAAVGRLGEGHFVAAHGVGEILAVVEAGSIQGVREWAERGGGALVIERAPDSLYEWLDPWGAPPSTVELQHRIKAAFDPLRVLVPGRLPGGV